jgi:GT2 family glycosyltransferase
MNTPSPVRLVQVEIDGEQSGGVMGVEPRRRHWVEVVRRGQILGIVERTSDDEGALPINRESLAREFEDAETATLFGDSVGRLPTASVVVPTIYRRVDLLNRLVQSLLDLDYPDYEIIVVDNRVGSGHAPIPPFTQDGRVKIVQEPTRGVSAARNRGFAESRGEFVAFTDDDAKVDHHWLRALGAAFNSDASVDAIGGMVRPFELDTEPQLWFEEFYGGFTRSFRAKQWSLESVGASDPLFPYSPGHFGAGVNMAIRRSAFERSGGFDLRLGAGTIAKGAEDLRLFMDVVLRGGKIAYVPSAMVRHSHRRTERQFMEQVFGYGVGLTALFTDLIVDDSSHLTEILKRVPRGLRMLLVPSEHRSLSIKTSYPRWTQLVQLVGMVYGPFAFMLSAIQVRRARGR